MKKILLFVMLSNHIYTQFSHQTMNEDGYTNVSQPEHRIWHQLQLHTKYGKVRTMQWVRLEERFRQNIKN